METRTCHGLNSVCEDKEKPLSEFYTEGKAYPDNLCKKCRIKVQCTGYKKKTIGRVLKKAGRPRHGDRPVSEVVNNLFKSTLVI